MVSGSSAKKINVGPSVPAPAVYSIYIVYRSSPVYFYRPNPILQKHFVAKVDRDQSSMLEFSPPLRRRVLGLLKQRHPDSKPLDRAGF
jgi:hypothetical protein